MTKQDARDIRRTLGRAVLEGREPTEREVSEALCLKLIRDSLRDGKLTLPSLRKQFGGPTREVTIRKAARAIAFYMTQVTVDLEQGSVSVPPGMREMFLALRGGQP